MDFLLCLAQDAFNCMKKGPELPTRIDVERGGFENILKNKVEKKPKKQK